MRNDLPSSSYDILVRERSRKEKEALLAAQDKKEEERKMQETFTAKSS